MENPRLEALFQMFSPDKLFSFCEICDGLIIYQTDQENKSYRMKFHPNSSAQLEPSCLIGDIIAAIDYDKYFELEINGLILS